jgi:hypothetical protein
MRRSRSDAEISATLAWPTAGRSQGATGRRRGRAQPHDVVPAAAEDLRERQLVHFRRERHDRHERVPHLCAHLEAAALQRAVGPVEQQRMRELRYFKAICLWTDPLSLRIRPSAKQLDEGQGSPR